MGDPTRPALEALQREFLRVASMYPPLYHQLFVVFDRDDITSESWSAFAAANRSKDWQAWHGPVEGQEFDWFGRFYGDEAGLAEFKQLAHSLYLVIRQIDPRLGADGGFDQCLDLLHRIAAYWPTQLIRSDEGRWGLGVEHEQQKNAYAESENFEEFCELDDLEDSTATDEQGVVCPLHPIVDTIQNNLYSAFASLIGMIMDDENAFFISEWVFTEPDYPRLGQSKLISEENLPEATPVTPATPAEPEGDYVFAFDVRRQQWHVRYRWGDGPTEAEDEWLTKSKATQAAKYLAYILKRPHEWIPCTEVFPPPRKDKSRSTVGGEEIDPVELAEPAAGRTHDPADREALKQSLFEIVETEEKLKQARKNSDENSELKLEKELKNRRKAHNIIWDKYGNRRDDTASVDDQRATNRVRNGISRFTAILSPSGKHPLPHLYEHLRLRRGHRKNIDVGEGLACYNPKIARKWSVVLPPQ